MSLVLFFPRCVSLQEDEQLLAKSFNGRRYIRNGPGVVIAPWLGRITLRDGITLSDIEYLKVRNLLSGVQTIVRGPCLYFLEADEEIVYRGQGINLSNTQYALVTNRTTGEKRHVRGPILYFPDVNEDVSSEREAVNLSNTSYIYVKNKLTGEVRTEVGPQLFFPTEDEEHRNLQSLISLHENQYVKIKDGKTGNVRVERGEASVILEPTESVEGSVCNGVNVDDDKAVMVRNKASGQLELITDKQVFIPSASQDFVAEMSKIRLEEYHTAVVKDNRAGTLMFRKGPDSFFLEPHCELLELTWSTGIHKDRKNLNISIFDSRPKFMWYDFEARTKDNVEISLGITFFWRMVDIKQMVNTSDDAPGDVCSHARSTIIQAISQIALEPFLDSFNQVVEAAVLKTEEGEEEDMFYKNRGLDIMEVEVRSIACKDAETQRILQEIIQNSTDRINRLQKQESENEVMLKKFQGEIEAQKLKGELLDIQKDHARKEGAMIGEKEAQGVASFIEGLDSVVSDQKAKVQIYNTIRKAEALALLSKGNARLFFTPQDVDLKIDAA